MEKASSWFAVFAMGLGLSFTLACTPYKPGTYVPPNLVKGAEEAAQAGESTSKSTAEDTMHPDVILDTTKIGAAAYKAEIVFQEQKETPILQDAAPKTTINRDFTGGGPQATIDISGLPIGVKGLLTLTLSQDGVVKFVAKRSQTKLESGINQKIVIDDCLVLPAPWDGASNDGSCAWTIEDMN